MGSSAWFDKFKGSYVDFKNTMIADHALELLNFQEEEGKSQPPFKYLNMWQNHANYEQVVIDAWHRTVDSQANQIISLYKQLANIKNALKQFNKYHF